MKLLLAVDGSRHAEWACELVCSMPGLDHTIVYLLHVTTPLPEPTTMFPSVFLESDLLLREQIEAEHETRAAARLETARSLLPGTLQVVTQHRVGHSAAEILTAAQELEINLIVLGARGIDEVPQEGLGGVAQKVSRYAPCPVLIAREAGTRLDHVLVGLDRGENDTRIIDYLGQTPWLRNCPLTLAHVVEDRYLQESRIAASQFAGSEAYLRRLQGALTSEGQDYLEQVAQQLRASNPKRQIDTVLMEGEPTRCLRERANSGKFTLLVLGSRGRNALVYFLMGSTSQRLLQQANTSTLLLRS